MKQVIIGFTGSRSGMTHAQLKTMNKFLTEMKTRVTTFGSVMHLVHGDCVGADEGVDGLCKSLGIPTAVRPGNIPQLRANVLSTALEAPEGPLLRNKKIVADCDLLVACPSSEKEVLRSGTWATIREGRRTKKQVFIITPDGFMVEDSSGPLPPRAKHTYE